MSLKRYLGIAAAALAVGGSQSADAAGFFLIEQSVSSMGNAYAGASAVAQDATTIFFNPAGMTKLPCMQAAVGGHIVLPSIHFHDDGSIAAPSGQTLSGEGGTSREPGFVGNLYIVKNDPCSGLAFGLGVTTPYGLVTDWGHEWKGRYYAIRSAILTILINPSVAYQINNCWSIGAGFDVQYLHAKLTNAVDFGLIGTLQQIGGLTPQGNDGIVRIVGDSWGVGANAGILYEPWCGTRFGIGFRSEIKHKIDGVECFEDVPVQFQSIPAIANPFLDTKTRADVTLPSLVSFSAVHRINDCWEILADATWFKWKVVKDLRFRFHNPAQPDAITTLKWENTWRYSLGFTYRPDCNTQIRTGFAYDNSPTPNKELRTPRLPDTDRVWLTVGLGYQWNDCLHFDFGYAHIFAYESKIDKTDAVFNPSSEDFLRGGLKGDFHARTDLVSAQLVWDF